MLQLLLLEIPGFGASTWERELSKIKREKKSQMHTGTIVFLINNPVSLPSRNSQTFQVQVPPVDHRFSFSSASKRYLGLVSKTI